MSLPRQRGRPRKLHDFKALSCRIPNDLYMGLRHYALGHSKSFNDVMIEALQQYWNTRPERAEYAALLAAMGVKL